MADYIRLSSARGRLSYFPPSDDDDDDDDDDHDHDQNPFFQQTSRPTYIRTTRLLSTQLSPRRQPQTQRRSSVARLAESRDKAFRFFRSALTSLSKPDDFNLSQPPRRPSQASLGAESVDMPGVDFLRGGHRPHNASSTAVPTARRPSLFDEPSMNDHMPPAQRARAESAATERSRSGSLVHDRARSGSLTIPDEKPLAAGGGVSIGIHLAEPVLFLQGYDINDSSSRTTAMLRGSFHLKVTKAAKIKTVSLKFRGVATTKWPEGIPPKKTEFEETDTLMSHTWPFFNAQFATAEGGSCADQVRLANGQTSDGSHGTPYLAGSPVVSTTNLSSQQHRKLSLQVSHSKSFDRSENLKVQSVAQKGYRTFHPGDYIYNFELPLDSRLPETIDVDLGSVKYELEATVERAGAFRGNLLGSKEVQLIRAPSEGSLEQVEPIAISRNWEDQLHYDIVISGKSFPLGAKIPIAFKLTPLAKVQCHRIKVYVTENTEYFCSQKRVHRMEPTRKILLFEKRSDGHSTSTFPGSTIRVTAGGGVPFDQRVAAASGEEVPIQDTSNLLGILEGRDNVGPTEMEFSVQLPGCQHATEKDKMNRLHFDTTHQNIQVHHWIKIVMRLSKPDKDDPTKRRHFEISIDSPFHILSCRANQANTALPAYSSPDAGDGTSQMTDCGCPGAPRRRISPSIIPTLNSFSDQRSGGDNGLPPSLARPQQVHLGGNAALQRPIHMLRAPSFNPPAFEDVEPPPPLITPPPEYNDIASPSSGLADYFSRLADTYSDTEPEDDSDGGSPRGSRRGRVNVPLTPGSRVNRSMEINRRWVPVGP